MISTAATRTSSAAVPSRQTITSLIIGFSQTGGAPWASCCPAIFRLHRRTGLSLTDVNFSNDAAVIVGCDALPRGASDDFRTISPQQHHFDDRFPRSSATSDARTF